ncbi:MAG: hypothetical protein H7Z11_20280 [Verrucomicrobia bacterium]|nr:hypothetical protein [Leptolyngbya sp. ES-bin-22]
MKYQKAHPEVGPLLDELTEADLCWFAAHPNKKTRKRLPHEVELVEFEAHGIAKGKVEYMMIGRLNDRTITRAPVINGKVHGFVMSELLEAPICPVTTKTPKGFGK